MVKIGLISSGLKTPDELKDVLGIDRHCYYKKQMCGKWTQYILKDLLKCLTSMSVQPQELQQILLLAYAVWYVREVKGNIFQNIVFKCHLIKL